jgi:hypothetical protein
MVEDSPRTATGQWGTAAEPDSKPFARSDASGPEKSGHGLMTEAASTSEMLVNFYQTKRRYNPEDSHLQKQSQILI